MVSGEPEVVKSVAEQESSEVQDVLRPLDGPEHAGVFEPFSDDVRVVDEERLCEPKVE